MKNSDLHKTLEALDFAPVDLPRHQRSLKDALVSYQTPKQTTVTKFRATSKNLIGVTMSHKRTFFGASTLALLAVFTLSIMVYSYRYSPRAEAQQLVGHSIGLVRTFGTGQMSKLQSQLGGDPVQALEEAKQAKDLTVLTPDEFKAESAKHKGMSMSSLGSNGPQYGSVGFGINGAPDPTNPATSVNGEQHFTTGGAIGSGDKGTVSIHDGVATSSGPILSQSGPGQPGPVELPKPSQYLRYTNSTGHVVVLGLDDKGVPINKTIFMTDAEVQNMQR